MAKCTVDRLRESTLNHNLIDLPGGLERGLNKHGRPQQSALTNHFQCIYNSYDNDDNGKVIHPLVKPHNDQTEDHIVASGVDV